MKKIIIFMLMSINILLANLVQDENLLVGELDNGLKYFVYPHSKPSNLISVRLRVNAGSLFEKEGEEGLAHFLEHMAFNGTEKYEENELIRVLESMGVAFGPELNAYTSFDETVYMLDGQSKHLETFIDIMHQWAFKMLLDPKEIESEKGVVIEEWRRNTGLRKEMNDFYYQYLFDNSLYFQRLPIGLVPSVKKFNRALLENFYKRWYAPNNMLIYIAGDIGSKEEAESLIKKYFSNEEKIQLEEIEDLKKREFLAKDKIDTFIHEELRTSSFTFIQSVEEKEAEAYLVEERKNLISELAGLMIDIRYKDKLNSLNTNLTSINLNHSSFNDYFAFNEFSVSLKDGREKEGIAEAFSEFNQILEGFLLEELEYAVKISISDYENYFKTIENVETPNIINRMTNFDFDKYTYLNLEDEINYKLALLKEITLEEVNDYIRNFFDGIESYYLYTSFRPLSISEISKSINMGIENKLEPYKLKESSGEIITKEIIAGEILKEEYFKDLDYYLLTLSNGSRVYLKNIDYNKNELSFYAYARGGMDYIETEELPYVEFFQSIIRSAPGTMTKRAYDLYRKSKQFSLNLAVDQDSQYFYSMSPKNQIEDVLMNFHAFVSEAKLDEEQFLIDKKLLLESIRNRDNLRANEFWKEFRNLSSNNDPRRRWLELEDIENINLERVLELYKERFYNTKNFDYYIVGDFNYEEVKEYIKLYLASLNEGEKEDYNYIKPDFFQENIEFSKNLNLGEEATVVIYSGNNQELDENFEYYINMATSVIDTELIKEIREKLGGVYNISSWVEASRHNLNRGRLGISFTCDPSRVEELTSRIYSLMDEILEKNISKESIDFIHEKYRRDYERSLNTNDFYEEYFINLLEGRRTKLSPDEFDKLVKEEDIKEFIRKIYGAYRGVFILYPIKQ